MSRNEDSNSNFGRDAVEELLVRAVPRPLPPAAEEAVVRDAIHAEWRRLTSRRRLRRRGIGVGMAATALLGIAVGVYQLRMPAPIAAPVATITKSFGSLFIVDAASELRAADADTRLVVGQTIVTGEDSGVGLEWGRGGSLRIDAQTRIRVVAPDAVYLESGRVYFDSAPSPLISSALGSESIDATNVLSIETRHGVVTHIGTQFMAAADRERLAVSVREGRVRVSGMRYAVTAVAGQQLTVSGAGRPGVANIAAFGDAWRWVEATSPPVSLDGRSVHDFLTWISRETGLTLEYGSDAARALAEASELRGLVQTEPTEALQIYAGSVDLDWRSRGGALYVTATDVHVD